MKLIIDNDELKMAYISGPKHNFLSLTISENKLNFEFTLEDINKSKEKTLVDKKLLKKQILNGLHRANQDLGKSFRVVRVGYIGSDT
ncbi:MAG: hypothetical protein ACKOAD_03880, partial [Gammaproteobacteria bacterium]